jgi:CubicO group peptidase (beta-lactamase class C family)
MTGRQVSLDAKLGAARSAGLRWVTAALVGSLLTGACTSGPGVDPPGAAGSASGVPSASAQSPGPGSTPAESAQLLPEASTPAERQIDQEVAGALEARFATPGYRQLRSVVVLADGRTVLERYYQSGPSDYHHVWSVTKSVMSTLVGIAIAQGKLLGVKQTLEELLPAYAGTMPSAVAGTTLEQVLTMTGGFGDDPGQRPTPVADWVAEILREPYSRPGEGFHYSNGGSHLLSAILVQATGMSTLDYAREVLFDPLGIPSTPAYEPVATGEDWKSFDESFETADFAWAVDPQGVHIAPWGLRLRALDLAKIGLLYLNEGRWQDRQVVPEDWIREATTAQVETGGGYTPMYGYQWWVTTADGVPAYAALGSGGQVIAVVPSRGLVVVFQFDGAGGGLGRMLPIVDTLIAPAYQP